MSWCSAALLLLLLLLLLLPAFRAPPPPPLPLHPSVSPLPALGALCALGSVSRARLARGHWPAQSAAAMDALQHDLEVYIVDRVQLRMPVDLREQGIGRSYIVVKRGRE